MTDHEGDRQYYLEGSGGLEKWSVAREEAEGERQFFQKESLESNSVPVTPGISSLYFTVHYVLLYSHNGSSPTKVGNRTQTVYFFSKCICTLMTLIVCVSILL